MIKTMIKKMKDKRTGQANHYDLWSESGEAVRDGRSPSWEKYPRPQMKRDSFFLLKDGWTLNNEAIRMPFPPQSMLSGYKKEVGSHLIYEKKFTLPENFLIKTSLKTTASKNGSCVGPLCKAEDMETCWTKTRLLLHFGAADQVAEVYVNDIFVGKHEGGYLPFTFDITDAIKNVGTQNREIKNIEAREAEILNNEIKNTGIKTHGIKSYGGNCLTVKVTDELDKNYPYGKQTKKRGGMWYTPVSGIWQNVWMEAVPEVYIKKIVLKPDLSGVNISLDCDCESFTATVILDDGKTLKKEFKGNAGRLELAGEKASDGSWIQPKCWTPETPYLYEMKIEAGNDTIETYFALRTIKIEKRKGIKRVCLNGKPIFLHGILDQGYYSDGLYLPANEEEYEQDILRMKNLGYNMLRKHVKIEPEYFYYACDKLGMLVMQDMVNNGSYSFLFDTALPTIGLKKRRDTGISLKGKRQQIFIEHTKETIEHLYNHPSIVAYTIFNEGWGQFQSDYMYDYVKALDDTRLIDATSGWFAQKKNDFDSEHIYFKVIHLNVKERPLFVSECGGYSLQVDGHYYNRSKQYGYGACESKEQLTAEIQHMYREMILSSVPQGICGCIYTQLSDVEDEINGLYTYDRKVCKILPEKMLVLAKELQDAVE